MNDNTNNNNNHNNNIDENMTIMNDNIILTE